MTTPHELAYPYPTDAHHTLGALAGLLEQLPLTLHQAEAALNAMPEDRLALLSDQPTPARMQAQAEHPGRHAAGMSLMCRERRPELVAVTTASASVSSSGATGREKADGPKR